MQRTLEKIIHYAAGVSDPEKIILFGSMVNSKTDVFSDVDLLIITDDSFYKKDIARRIESYINEFSVKADVLVYSMKEIEADSFIPNSFLQGIIKFGKIVYKK